MLKVNKDALINCFQDKEYVIRYGDAAVERYGYTKALLNEIDNEFRYKNMKEPKKILDVGCGTGDLTKLLTERFPYAKVDAIDASQYMIDYAKQKFLKTKKGVKLYCSTVETFKNKEGLYDLIVGLYAFEYWKHDIAIKNLLSNLRDGGIIFLKNINGEISDEYLEKFISNYVKKEERQFFRETVKYLAIGTKECEILLKQIGIKEFNIFFQNRNAIYNSERYLNQSIKKIINYNVVIRKKEGGI